MLEMQELSRSWFYLSLLHFPIYPQQQAWKVTATVFWTVTLKKYKNGYFYGTSEIME